ncbi:MAG: OsmC family protein [Candidatus Ranarchaeia archaeon]
MTIKKLKPRYEFSNASTWRENNNFESKHRNQQTIKVSSPPDFGGAENNWYPEELLAAAISNCIILTYRHNQLLRDFEISKLEVTTTVTVEQNKKNRKYKITKIVIIGVSTLDDEDSVFLSERSFELAKECVVTQSLDKNIKKIYDFKTVVK